MKTDPVTGEPSAVQNVLKGISKRDKAILRDSYTCQSCGTRKDFLGVWKIKSDLSDKLENFITLCPKCAGSVLSIIATAKFPTSENDHLLKWCKKWAKEQGFYCEKVHGGSYQNAGIPDLDIIYHGISVRVELKLFGNPLTRIQYETMKEMQENGAVVGVAHTLEEFKMIIHKAECLATDHQFN